MKADINTTVDIPEGVTATVEGRTVNVSGKNQVERSFPNARISIKVVDGAVELSAKNATQREKRHMYTTASHIKNLVAGAQEDSVYKLKVCSGHFPMNVSIGNGVLTVKNFLGEAVPRTLKIKEGATVKLDGDIITVSAPYKELAGQQAAAIEQLTRITNRDRRIFQDGLYIIEKNGVPVE